MQHDQMDDGKKEIIKRFDENVRGKTAETSTANSRHDGKNGHWLERQMGVKANASNSPDLFGYEMKNQTTSKTTFGDWSADYYIFKDPEYGITRNEFIAIFGKPNTKKYNRYSWSGEPCPKIGEINSFGQWLEVDKCDNIIAYYDFKKDGRDDKIKNVPPQFQAGHIRLAKWEAASIRKKLEQKFNQKGWFKCLKDQNGIYNEIVFGDPISFKKWISLVRNRDVFFDSGMYETNTRNYSQWRANNSFWDSLVISRY